MQINIGESNLVKCLEEHFDKVNISNLDTLNFNWELILMCTCWPSGTGIKVPCKTHIIESCICGHYVLKGFWTMALNEVLVCIQENENVHVFISHSFSYWSFTFCSWHSDSKFVFDDKETLSLSCNSLKILQPYHFTVVMCYSKNSTHTFN